MFWSMVNLNRSRQLTICFTLMFKGKKTMKKIMKFGLIACLCFLAAACVSSKPEKQAVNLLSLSVDENY